VLSCVLLIACTSRSERDADVLPRDGSTASPGPNPYLYPYPDSSSPDPPSPDLQELAIESQVELEVLGPKGRERVAVPVASVPIDLHVVARVADPLELTRDACGTRVLIVGKLPFPLDMNATPRVLPGVLEGLPNVHRVGSVDVAGDFRVGGAEEPASCGLDRGWMVWTLNHIKHDLEPMSWLLEWTRSGWRSVSRARVGQFHEIPRFFLTRGDSVFVWIEHWAMQDRNDHYTHRPERPSKPRRAPAGRFVRLTGDAPEPLGVVPEWAPTTAKRSHGGITFFGLGARSWSSFADDAQGNLYQTTSAVDPDDAEAVRAVLHHWPAGRSDPLALTLPELAGQPEPAQLRVKLDSGKNATPRLLVFGNHRIRGVTESVAYLAMGEPEALRHVPIAIEGAPCLGRLSDAVLGPGDEPWIVLDHQLFVLDSGVLRHQRMPAFEPGGAREWIWKDRWTAENDPTAAGDASVVEIDRVDDVVWLNLSMGSTSVVARTSPSVAVRLPSGWAIAGEVERAESGIELRVRSGLDVAGLATFETEVLPLLREREQVVQVYTSLAGDTSSVVVVLDPEAWHDGLVAEYGALLGHPVERLGASVPIERMLFDPRAR